MIDAVEIQSGKNNSLPIGKGMLFMIREGISNLLSTKTVILGCVLFMYLAYFVANPVIAGGADKNPFKGVKMEVLGYIDYSYGRSPLAGDTYEEYNEFSLNRGYFTFKKSDPEWIGMRVTMDIHRDNTGDYKVREKYLFAELRHTGYGFFTDWRSEIGLGHIPWLDFEEHINIYRCQGTMAIERAGVLNSADLGISLGGNFGGKLNEAEKLTGNSHYDGRFGSWHIGVYNGGGYHADENNENKTFQGRLTFRPIPDIMPGLQLSYFGIFGKGNTMDEPDYKVNIGMLSIENPRYTLSGQLFATTGNAKGTWIDSTGAELKTQGVSVFGNISPFKSVKLSLFGRFDRFDTDKDNLIADKTAYTMIVGGLSYGLSGGNMVILDFETTSYDSDSGGRGKLPVAGNSLGDDYKVQMVYQIKY